MTEQEQLATAIARFRPLTGPLPLGFDVDSLPIFRTPIPHPTTPAGKPDVASTRASSIKHNSLTSDTILSYHNITIITSMERERLSTRAPKRK
jgi:hypothetical protein